MKRYVSYLYSTYNNQKIHNAGFARVELRTGRNRIDIHLRENGYAGKTGTVYLFTREQENIQGIPIGSIVFRGSQADFRYEQAEENIGQTPWQIDQMHGIIIMVDDRGAFLSQWDEEPVDTTRFKIWKEQTAEAQGKADKSTDTKEENINKAKILGAYATILYKDDTEESIVMTMEQIRTSWKKSKLNPDSKDSTHSQFTEDMCKRTVINKICKYYINTKDDSNLNIIRQAFETSDEEMKEAEVEYEIESNANKEMIDIEDEEVVEDTEIASEEIDTVSEEEKTTEGPAF